ncbi:DUF3953 domain-containing protein [Sporosarcina sp. BI001-red]|uniref:DUF3953 domain-containing protein n=1 Tax=Sporosarcina sp. BI001-red TaxID=2282866 RepID=UPI000E278868|nr:DUF3953 domain-containing protein [Sporosarcina sp. BI001-red]REB07076.1 DUF3953 domain-containing protein [Sporosarcina sp. BI001-red]
MLKIVGVMLSVIVIAFGCYALITENFEFMPHMLFFLGVLLMGLGVRELKVKRTTNAVVTILGSAFILFVAIYTF